MNLLFFFVALFDKKHQKNYSYLNAGFFMVYLILEPCIR